MSAPPDVREIARIIYNAVYRPGTDEGTFTMPTFEQAEADRVGGYDRALEAAVLVLSRIQPLKPT